MGNITAPGIEEMLEAGVHFGHITSRWHPKMEPFLYGKRGTTHIIDLAKTQLKLAEAAEFVKSAVSKGKSILFVGVKPLARKIVAEEEHEKLEHDVGGLRDVVKAPEILFAIDAKYDKTAVAEARKLKLPVIALADSNINPCKITHPIPANDDALKSIALLTRVIADAVIAGRGAIE